MTPMGKGIKCEKWQNDILQTNLSIHHHHQLMEEDSRYIYLYLYVNEWMKKQAKNTHTHTHTHKQQTLLLIIKLIMMIVSIDNTLGSTLNVMCECERPKCVNTCGLRK